MNGISHQKPIPRGDVDYRPNDLRYRKGADSHRNPVALATPTPPDGIGEGRRADAFDGVVLPLRMPGAREEASFTYIASRTKLPEIPRAARLPASLKEYIAYGNIWRRIFAVKLGMLAGPHLFHDYGRPRYFLSPQ